MNNVINFLGTTLLGCVLIIGVLALKGAPVPDVLQNVTVGALAGLAGLLARKEED